MCWLGWILYLACELTNSSKFTITLHYTRGFSQWHAQYPQTKLAAIGKNYCIWLGTEKHDEWALRPALCRLRILHNNNNLHTIVDHRFDIKKSVWLKYQCRMCKISHHQFLDSTCIMINEWRFGDLCGPESSHEAAGANLDTCTDRYNNDLKILFSLLHWSKPAIYLCNSQSSYHGLRSYHTLQLFYLYTCC